MANSKVLLVIASEGYHHVEYGVPKKILTDTGFHVVTASNKAIPAIAKDGSTTEVDITIDKVNPKDYAGIYFIGGPGAMDHLDNETSYKLIKKAAKDGVPFGAICVAPRILAKAGVLKDKKATGWNFDNELGDIYAQHNVLFDKDEVVTDGNITTATGPPVAQQFAEEIVNVLQSGKAWG